MWDKYWPTPFEHTSFLPAFCHLTSLTLRLKRCYTTRIHPTVCQKCEECLQDTVACVQFLSPNPEVEVAHISCICSAHLRRACSACVQTAAESLKPEQLLGRIQFACYIFINSCVRMASNSANVNGACWSKPSECHLCVWLPGVQRNCWMCYRREWKSLHQGSWPGPIAGCLKGRVSGKGFSRFWFFWTRLLFARSLRISDGDISFCWSFKEHVLIYIITKNVH